MADVNDYDGMIIRRTVGRREEYLVALPYPDTLTLRWSDSPWEGCPIKHGSEARRLARRVGGKAVLFNSATGVIRDV